MCGKRRKIASNGIHIWKWTQQKCIQRCRWRKHHKVYLEFKDVCNYKICLLNLNRQQVFNCITSFSNDQELCLASEASLGTGTRALAPILFAWCSWKIGIENHDRYHPEMPKIQASSCWFHLTSVIFTSFLHHCILCSAKYPIIVGGGGGTMGQSSKTT